MNVRELASIVDKRQAMELIDDDTNGIISMGSAGRYARECGHEYLVTDSTLRDDGMLSVFIRQPRRFYFTFGSCEQHPYGRDKYVLVLTYGDRHNAVAAFKKVHPCIVDGIINCADYYTEKQWNDEAAAYYADQLGPVEIIRDLEGR